jgi:glycerophosphoryl diester phosphodiesterase
VLSFLDHPAPLAFAHRGGTEAAPENTLAAFRAAYDLGYRYLETDAHLTADGAIVAFHDERLDRVTDGSGAIADLPLARVRAAKVGGSEQIPLLSEILDAFPDAKVNIDAKSDAVVEPLAALLRERDAVSRVCIGSFAANRLLRMRSLLGPQLCTSMSPAEVARLVIASRTTALAGSRSVPCAQVPLRRELSVPGGGRTTVTIVGRRLVRTARRLGVQVHVWTVDDPVEMERLIDLGVDGIMTDRPSVLKDVMVRRGLWR